jgi:serine/threonine protein kinase
MNDTEENRSELRTVLKLCTGNHSRRAHPHIVRVFDGMLVERSEHHAPGVLIQMELCEDTLGGLLKRAFEAGDNWRIDFIHNTLCQILDGLQHCHSKNMIHRDLKPNNGITYNVRLILVLYTLTNCDCHPQPNGYECRFLLSDFGFSQALAPGATGESCLIRGTRAYIAPELVTRKEFSPKTDIWAFGCIMFEVGLTGKRLAFEDDYESRKYVEGKFGFNLPQLRKEDNPRLSEWHRNRFNSLVGMCFHREPDQRPSAEMLRQMLNEWKDQRV